MTRVVVDLLRPASYRVIPPEDGEKDFTILFDDTRARPTPSADGVGAGHRGVARPDRARC